MIALVVKLLYVLLELLEALLETQKVSLTVLMARRPAVLPLVASRHDAQIWAIARDDRAHISVIQVSRIVRVVFHLLVGEFIEDLRLHLGLPQKVHLACRVIGELWHAGVEAAWVKRVIHSAQYLHMTLGLHRRGLLLVLLFLFLGD